MRHTRPLAVFQIRAVFKQETFTNGELPMNFKNLCGAAALTVVMTFAVAAQAADAPAAPGAAPAAMAPAAAMKPAAATEKCYGVAKAGKSVSIDLPVGVCEKLVNGSLVAVPAVAPAAKP
jgi:uncharacterized membrane protein